MNNAKIALDNILVDEPHIDTTPELRARMEKIVEVIEALDQISHSSYWTVLKQQVFDGVTDELKRRISTAKDNIELYRLQGQIAWAEKYSDLHKLSDLYRRELAIIKSKINA